MDKAKPDWRDHLDLTGATTTRFKLADGGKSAAPAGQITLDLTMGGQSVRGKFWVLEQLTTNMIVGSNLLSWIGATIDYNRNEIVSRQYPDMGKIPFGLKGSRKWRSLTSIVAERDIILRPNTVDVVVGVITTKELGTLTVPETDYGGVIPIASMGDRGVEVKHTLQAIVVTRKNRISTGRLNVVLQN